MAGAGEQAAGAMMMEDTLIIDSPSLKRKWLRVVEALFSAAVWVFFIYLFQTIVTTIMWILGLEHIYSYNFSPDSISSTLDAMLLALYTAVAAMVVLVVWAQWNYWRFGRLERRKPRPVVTKEEVAEQFAVPVDSVDKMQAAKFATMKRRLRGKSLSGRIELQPEVPWVFLSMQVTQCHGRGPYVGASFACPPVYIIF
jgi:poly-beta-1,6-N-acetyl-D-glucosamine biosynthesis protein PgaD